MFSRLTIAHRLPPKIMSFQHLFFHCNCESCLQPSEASTLAFQLFLLALFRALRAHLPVSLLRHGCQVLHIAAFAFLNMLCWCSLSSRIQMSLSTAYLIRCFTFFTLVMQFTRLPLQASCLSQFDLLINCVTASHVEAILILASWFHLCHDLSHATLSASIRRHMDCCPM